MTLDNIREDVELEELIRMICGILNLNDNINTKEAIEEVKKKIPLSVIKMVSESMRNMTPEQKKAFFNKENITNMMRNFSNSSFDK